MASKQDLAEQLLRRAGTDAAGAKGMLPDRDASVSFMIRPMARAIVRYSIDGESANETANRARAALELEPSGFRRIGTGTYEATGPSGDLIPKLCHLLNELRTPPGGGTIDHLWVYLDSPPGTSSNT